MAARKKKVRVPSQLAREELLELVGELAGALTEAQNELEILRDEQQLGTDDHAKALRERLALAATLKRLPPRLREKAAPVYREELGKVGYVDAPGYSVTVRTEPMKAIEYAFERLFAAGCIDRDVWELDAYGRRERLPIDEA